MRQVAVVQQHKAADAFLGQGKANKKRLGKRAGCQTSGSPHRCRWLSNSTVDMLVSESSTSTSTQASCS